MKCSPDTPAYPLPFQYNLRVMRIFDDFKREVSARQAEQTHVLALSAAQRYVIQELQILYGQTQQADIQGQINHLSEVFKKPLYQAVRQEINRLKSNEVRGHDLLSALSRIYLRYGLSRLTIRIQENQNESIPVIICSEGLV